MPLSASKSAIDMRREWKDMHANGDGANEERHTNEKGNMQNKFSTISKKRNDGSDGCFMN